MGGGGGLSNFFQGVARAPLVSGVTPLERGPVLDSGAKLWVKRDDLTGLGVGSNKFKLEFLCGAAQAENSLSLVTVGAGQSNHCRMTAAAGALLGLDVHLVLSGERPERLEGNQFSARCSEHNCISREGGHHWGALEIVRSR